MAIISSFGTVQRIAAPSPLTSSPASGAGGSWFGGSAFSYTNMYRTQPNVRTVVDFLARNVAQLGLHAFRRVSDTDRERLADLDVINWLTNPNPSTTRYRLIESTMQDLGIFLNAYWLKVRMPDRLGLVRLPPTQVEVEGGLFPSLYRWIAAAGGEPREFAPTEIVHFGGYDPENSFLGLSPLETLRRILLEEISAQDYRAYYWRNHARMDGVIERDKDGKPWTPDQWKDWRTRWREQTTGRENSGTTAILGPGMTWKERSYSAKDSELTPARKLTREEVARAYHVPLPMVGILDHATFSNIKEQHKQLYQDTLGPWLVMIVEELERQLLPESSDPDGVYLEFNIAEKLKGSFEEQADSLMKLVGRPLMTVNEGRARVNLPKDAAPSSDEIAQPLNTSTPSQNSSDDNASDSSTSSPAVEVVDDEGLEEEAARVIKRHQARQAARLSGVDESDRPGAFNLTRYNAELTDDLVALGLSINRASRLAVAVNTRTLQALTEAAIG